MLLRADMQRGVAGACCHCHGCLLWSCGLEALRHRSRKDCSGAELTKSYWSADSMFARFDSEELPDVVVYPRVDPKNIA